MFSRSFPFSYALTFCTLFLILGLPLQATLNAQAAAAAVQEAKPEEAEKQESKEDAKEGDKQEGEDGEKKEGEEGEKKEGDQKEGEDGEKKEGEEEKKKEKPWKEPKPNENGVITLAAGLSNPCGLAIQPETNHVFIADSGAGRIVRFNNGKLEEIVTGLPVGKFDAANGIEVGPLGIFFLNKDTLIVGGGGGEAGEELLAAYKVPEAGGKAVEADKTFGDAMKLEKTDDAAGEGDFYAIAKTPKGLWVTCRGDDEKGWVAKLSVKKGKPALFERAIATSELTKTSQPMAITVSKDEGYLVVAQAGKIGEEGNSVLGFYSPGDVEKEGTLLGSFQTPLADITGLAYGTKKTPARLYAIDYNWQDPTKGGLFKLIADADNPESCKADQILSLDKPTAMAFDATGNLYILVCGTPVPGIDGPCGQLLKIKGLEDPKKKKKETAEESANKAKEATDDAG